MADYYVYESSSDVSYEDEGHAGPIDWDEFHARIWPLSELFAQPDMKEFKRKCFVTVGATAGFPQLLEEVISDKFLGALEARNYGFLRVQCGPDHESFAAKVAAIQDKHGVNITCFERTDDMRTEYLMCRGRKGVQLAGCVVSHAGK